MLASHVNVGPIIPNEEAEDGNQEAGRSANALALMILGVITNSVGAVPDPATASGLLLQFRGQALVELIDVQPLVLFPNCYVLCALGHGRGCRGVRRLPAKWQPGHCGAQAAPQQ